MASNRLPVTRTRAGWRRSDGGLVSALVPVVGSRDASWLGWDGGAAVPERVRGLDARLVGVALSRTEVDAHYHGFANRTLWPLLHGLVEHYALEHRWWECYRSVNGRFAAALADEVERGDGPAGVWIHDYHLALVPARLRELAPQVPSLFFLHVPFPPPEVWERLPWGMQLLHGLLSADVVAFQSRAFRDNMRACALQSGLATPLDDETVRHEDRTVRLVAHPIGIDAARVEREAASPGVQARLGALRQRFAGRRVLLGVDRLDYTKGILERLRAFELLLEQRRDLRSRVVLVQLAVPSRGDIREYRDLRRAVEESVGRIIGRFTEPGGDPPIHYIHRAIQNDRLLALYRLADVAVVTPLRDGMNLVAKEFVMAQAAGDGAGVLLLSEFAGAWETMGRALPCNPYHVEGLAGALEARPRARPGRSQGPPGRARRGRPRARRPPLGGGRARRARRRRPAAPARRALVSLAPREHAHVGAVVRDHDPVAGARVPDAVDLEAPEAGQGVCDEHAVAAAEPGERREQEQGEADAQACGEQAPGYGIGSGTRRARCRRTAPGAVRRRRRRRRAAPRRPGARPRRRPPAAGRPRGSRCRATRRSRCGTRGS